MSLVQGQQQDWGSPRPIRGTKGRRRNNGRDDDKNDGDWGYMEEKEREEDDDNNDDVVDITVVQFFGMPDEEFIGKET